MSKPLIPEHTHRDRLGEPFLIREAQPDDAQPLLAMVRAIFQERLPGLLTQSDEFTIDEAAERAFLQRHRDSDADAAFLATTLAGEPIGFLNGTVTPRKLLRHTWSLGISIAKPWRSRGIGRALMNAAIDYVRAHPALDKIALAVFADNAPALALYRSLGFLEEGRRVKHIRREDEHGAVEYVDNLLMYRWLGR